MRSKVSSGKRRPSFLGLNVLSNASNIMYLNRVRNDNQIACACPQTPPHEAIVQ